MANPPKHERLRELFRRLDALPAAAAYAEARAQVTTAMDAVESDMTDIPYDPEMPEGERMYGPRDDLMKVVVGRPDLVRFRHTRHSTVIRDNGAVAFLSEPTKKVIYEKAGQDGRRVEYP